VTNCKRGTQSGAHHRPAGTRAVSAEPVLQVEGLTKRFRGLLATNALDFTVATGSVTSVIGPNGAGKSTLFNLLTRRRPAITAPIAVVERHPNAEHLRLLKPALQRLLASGKPGLKRANTVNRLGNLAAASSRVAFKSPVGEGERSRPGPHRRHPEVALIVWTGWRRR
jgi:ATPase subunit of ABC transporter with duplicated ATPase domains